jgi:hypothetical protein
MTKEKMTKEEEERELKWKVDDAIRAFTEYKKLTEDKKIREKVITELKKRANEYNELAKEL